MRLKLFAHPFDLSVEDSPDNCQMELIELQAYMVTKTGYYENSLVDYYKLYVCGKFPTLFHHAIKIISIFGSTYCCDKKKEAHQNQMSKSAD